jgi:F-type H+-transporting ATPase subunit delta
MAGKEHSRVAKRLARLVVEGGESSVREIRPALEKLLEGRSATDRKAFLKAFHTAVVREIQKDTLTVESAQELPEEVLQQVVSGFQREGGRSLQVITKINPDLIAGLRVRLGDTVYDASLSSNLNRLSSRIR